MQISNERYGIVDVQWTCLHLWKIGAILIIKSATEIKVLESESHLGFYNLDGKMGIDLRNVTFYLESLGFKETVFAYLTQSESLTDSSEEVLESPPEKLLENAYLTLVRFS